MGVTDMKACGASLLGLLSGDVAGSPSTASNLDSNTGSSAVGMRGKTLSRRTSAQQMSPLELMLRMSPRPISDSDPATVSVGLRMEIVPNTSSARLSKCDVLDLNCLMTASGTAQKNVLPSDCWGCSERRRNGKTRLRTTPYGNRQQGAIDLR